MSDCFSNHSILFCIWKIKLPSVAPKYIKFRQNKHNNKELFINDLVTINSDRFQLIPYVEDAWNYLYSEISNIIDKHAPLKTFCVQERQLPWVSTALVNLYRQRDHAWAKYCSSKDPADWEVYRTLKNHCKTQTRNEKSDYYKEGFAQNLNNPK